MTLEDKLKNHDKFRLAKVVETHDGSDGQVRHITAEYRLPNESKGTEYSVGAFKQMRRSLHQTVLLLL